MISLEGSEIFSKERFIKISTHEIKKEGGEVEEVDDDDISITRYNDDDQTAHSISSNDISSFMHLIAKRSTPGRFFFISDHQYI